MRRLLLAGGLLQPDDARDGRGGRPGIHLGALLEEGVEGGDGARRVRGLLRRRLLLRAQKRLPVSRGIRPGRPWQGGEYGCQYDRNALAHAPPSVSECGVTPDVGVRPRGANSCLVHPLTPSPLHFEAGCSLKNASSGFAPFPVFTKSMKALARATPQSAALRTRQISWTPAGESGLSIIW